MLWKYEDKERSRPWALALFSQLFKTSSYHTLSQNPSNTETATNLYSTHEGHVVFHELSHKVEVSIRLFTVQNLNLFLSLCQLGQGSWQSCVLLHIAKHSCTFCKLCCIYTKLWTTGKKKKIISLWVDKEKYVFSVGRQKEICVLSWQNEVFWGWGQIEKLAFI